ncbi:MAG: hypothetical protein UT28_C0001G0309 [Berkelbacteria bacterium GW2011_GWE1_39_12]|uniref:Uncharacterized protein n=1 Tax=Berkelbacteria bacterium GW2011_GWE1_39_12 TaxID=1618337 RepID=A0A0G4B3W6_9BACT|nr:MAG: hypothetical protein UT28_C0001G0309 [Berkelbacteria bacterium GW2011_GWE1_39_12]
MEQENRVPVAEQLEEIEQVDEAIQYTLSADGTIQQENGIENGEGSALK